jgi:transcriptional regulator NrdR family protein
VKGSWKIRVLKRDSSIEHFNIAKLRLSLWRALGADSESFLHADWLAHAIQGFLHYEGHRAVSSRALFEMAVRSLRCVERDDAGDALEAHRRVRRQRRDVLTILHEDGRRSRWDRSWVTAHLRQRWSLGRSAAKALSAQIEADLLARPGELARRAVLDRVDGLVEAFGLAPWCLLASAPTP